MERVVKCKACGKSIPATSRKCGNCGLILTPQKKDAKRDKKKSQETEAARVASEFIQKFQKVVTSFIQRYKSCFKEGQLKSAATVDWDMNLISWRTCQQFVREVRRRFVDGIPRRDAKFKIETLDFDQLYQAFETLRSLTLFKDELDTIQTYVLQKARAIAHVPGSNPEEHWEMAFVRGMLVLETFLLTRKPAMKEYAAIQDKYSARVHMLRL